MNRLALLIACIGMTAAQASFAANAAFCKSLCTSEQRTCRADAQLPPKEERFMLSDTPDRNPFARTAQGEVSGQGTLALRADGDTNRRSDRLGACDTTYARCTRACTVPAQVKTPAPDHAG